MEFILNEETLWFVESVANHWEIESLIEGWNGDRKLLKEAFKWIENCSADNLPTEGKCAIEKFINDSFPSECNACSCEIPLEERMEARDNGGLCGHCIHVKERMDEE